jgi:hypothetical protein
VTDVPRIDVAETRRKVAAGEALLVCAYEDAEKCNRMKPEGSLLLSELKARLPSLPKEQTIIFYCA